MRQLLIPGAMVRFPIKLMTRAVLLAFAVGGAVFALLMAVSFIVSGVPREVYRASAWEAVEAGMLSRPAAALPGTGTARLQYKPLDCLILSMLTLDPKEDRTRSFISPVIPVDDRPPPNALGLPDDKMCRNLAVSVRDPGIPAQYYHRYLHGHWIVAGAMLPFMSFDAVTTGLFFLYILTLAAAAAAALARLLSPKSRNVPRDAAYAALAAGAMIFPGVQAFGWSISFVLSDLVLAAFLAYASFRAPSFRGGSEWIIATALFGALTAAFEFLNGAAPVALALLMVIVAVEDHPTAKERMLRLAVGTTCFAIGFAAMFLCKALAVAIVWGWPEITAAGGRLGTWIVHDNWSIAPANERMLAQHGLSGDDFKGSRPEAFLFGLGKMAMMSDIVGFGSRAVGLLITVGGPLAYLSAASYHFVSTNGVERTRAAAFLLAGACVIGWHFVFVSHTIVHANFMVRTLGWLAALCLGVIVWVAANRLSVSGADAANARQR